MITLTVKPKYTLSVEVYSQQEADKVTIESPQSAISLAILQSLTGPRGIPGKTTLDEVSQQQLAAIANIPDLSLMYQLARLA